MNLYLVRFDGEPYHVEAPSFGEAQRIWLEAMRERWGIDWNGDEEPDEIVRLDDKPVIRAGAGCAPAAPPPRRDQVVPTYRRRVKAAAVADFKVLVPFIRNYTAQHGTGPSRPDIAEAVGFSRESRRTTIAMLEKARAAGVIDWELDGAGRMVAGTIRVVDVDPSKLEPLRKGPGNFRPASRSFDALCTFIEKYTATSGRGPNKTDIKSALGYGKNSLKAVSVLLDEARAAGRVTWDTKGSGKYVGRTIRVLPAPAKTVPVHGHPDLPLRADPPSLHLPFTNGVAR